MRITAHLRAPGHIESAGQRVEVDNGLCLQDFRRIHVHINDHVEFLFRPAPGLRIHDDNVGGISRLSAEDLLRAARRERFFNLIERSVSHGLILSCSLRFLPVIPLSSQRSRSVSFSDTYLSARHTIQASRLLGRCVRFSGHMWLYMMCCTSSSASKYLSAFSLALSAWIYP